jgi:superfamily II DNA or RNA helicase
MTTIVPRQQQVGAIQLASNALRRFRKALVVLATGLGKTITSAFIAQKVKARRVLFLVHNNYILENSLEEYRRVFGESRTYALYNGLSKNGAADADFVFASFQTMGGNLSKWRKNHFDLLIVDEGHHAHAETYRPVIEHFKCARLGLTATPDRGDLQNIREIFGNEVVNVSLEEAVARGWLPRIEYHVVTDESLDEKALQEIATEIHESKKRFTMAEVNRRIFIKKRDEEIARIINGYSEKAIVFCASISHAERLSKSLELGASFHSEVGESQQGTWDQNQATLIALKNGTVRRVCAVNAFNEGVDVPSIGLVAFCRVTGVPTIFRQQLGRGLRPGKDKLVVLDFVGNLERVQLVLEMMNRISDLHEKFTPQGEMDREGYIRERFEVSGKGFEFTFSDEIVDLMKVLERCEPRKTKDDFYPTWKEASRAAIELGITSMRDYYQKYLEDSNLPSYPQRLYGDFPGWPVFLGGVAKAEIYTTWQEASRSAIALGIKSQQEYYKEHQKDPRLPADLYSSYSDFPGMRVFLGTESYGTWQESSKAAIALGIKSQAEYWKRYKEDPRLLATPHKRYPDFPGYRVMLGGSEKFGTWQEASVVAIAMGIKSSSEYKKRYAENPRLVGSPAWSYPDFPGWHKFLGKT